MPDATHANAALTPRARLRLARLIVDQGWPIPRAAERYDVSWHLLDQRAWSSHLAVPSGPSPILWVAISVHQTIRCV